MSVGAGQGCEHGADTGPGAVRARVRLARLGARPQAHPEALLASTLTAPTPRLPDLSRLQPPQAAGPTGPHPGAPCSFPAPHSRLPGGARAPHTGPRARSLDAEATLFSAGEALTAKPLSWARPGLAAPRRLEVPDPCPHPQTSGPPEGRWRPAGALLAGTRSWWGDREGRGPRRGWSPAQAAPAPAEPGRGGAATGRGHQLRTLQETGDLRAQPGGGRAPG